jgi:hypothetical protein
MAPVHWGVGVAEVVGTVVGGTLAATAYMLADNETNRLDSDRNHSFVAAAVAEAIVPPG